MADAPTEQPRPGAAAGSEARAGRAFAVLALVAIYAVAVLVRERYMTSIAGSGPPSYWMESAQHAWYTARIAERGSLPRRDPMLGWPDGLDLRTDTLLPMYVGGLLYRHAMVAVTTFHSWLVWYTRLASSLVIFGCYLLAREVSGSRAGALLAAAWCGWSVLGVASSSGHSVFHEHLGLPLFGLFLGCFLVYLRRRTAAVLAVATVLLILALQSWIVLSLFFGVFVGGVAVVLVVADDVTARAAWRGLLALTGSLAAFAIAWDGYLRRTGFLWSLPMLLACAVLAGHVLRRRGAPWPLVALLAMLPLGVHVVAPPAPELAHVGVTLAAKLRHWTKPADPAAIPFDARHLWGGDFDSPGAYRLISAAGLLALCGAPGIVSILERGRRGAMAPAGAFVLALALPSVLGYLVIAKAQPFLSLLVTPLVAVTWTRCRKRRLRILLAAACAFELSRSATGGVTALETTLRSLGIRGIVHPESVGHTSPQLEELLSWIRACTAPGEAFYADFFTSPTILLEADRPVVLHAFFQSDVPAKYEEQARAFAGPEEGLLSVMRRYRATYVLHSAAIPLRSDPWASFRYVNGDLDLDPASVGYLMSFRPEALAGLDLVFQGAVHRVFRLRDAGPMPATGYGCARRPGHHPLFDESALLAHLPGATMNERAQSFYMSRVRAYLLLDRAMAALAGGDTGGALDLAKQALRSGPDVPEAAALAARLTREHGDTAGAVAILEASAARKPSVPVLLELGLTHERRGDGAAALASYREAAEADPGDATAHHLLGRGLRASGRLLDAEASLRRSLELAPRSPALGDLADLLATTGRCRDLATLVGRHGGTPDLAQALASCEPAEGEAPRFGPPAP